MRRVSKADASGPSYALYRKRKNGVKSPETTDPPLVKGSGRAA
jgi:hypothetical protein